MKSSSDKADLSNGDLDSLPDPDLKIILLGDRYVLFLLSITPQYHNICAARLVNRNLSKDILWMNITPDR